MQMKPLKELIQDIEQEMRRLGYTEGSLNFYQNRWRMLTKFAEEKGEIFFSERLGIDFIEKHFHILEKDFDGTLTQAQVQNLRIIRMIGDFQLHHTVLRRYYKHKEILTVGAHLNSPLCAQISSPFHSHDFSQQVSEE